MLSPKPFSNNPMVVGFKLRKTSAILIPLGNKLFQCAHPPALFKKEDSGVLCSAGFYAVFSSK